MTALGPRPAGASAAGAGGPREGRRAAGGTGGAAREHDVDFVVVGFGLGALGVLLGLTLRDAASWRWRIRSDRQLAAPELVRRVAIGRACRAGGRVLAVAGGSACLATLLGLLLRLSDRAGAALVLVLLLLVTAGAIAWSAVYAHRYHPRPARVRLTARAAHAGEPSVLVPSPGVLAGAEHTGPPADPEPVPPEPIGAPVAAPPLGTMTDGVPDEAERDADPAPAAVSGLIAANGSEPMAPVEPAVTEVSEPAIAPGAPTTRSVDAVSVTVETAVAPVSTDGTRDEPPEEVERDAAATSADERRPERALTTAGRTP